MKNNVRDWSSCCCKFGYSFRRSSVWCVLRNETLCIVFDWEEERGREEVNYKWCGYRCIFIRIFTVWIVTYTIRKGAVWWRRSCSARWRNFIEMIVVIALAHVAVTVRWYWDWRRCVDVIFLEPSFEQYNLNLPSHYHILLSFLSQLPLLYKSNLLPGNAFWLRISVQSSFADYVASSSVEQRRGALVRPRPCGCLVFTYVAVERERANDCLMWRGGG